jgi:hypothetical protein
MGVSKFDAVMGMSFVSPVVTTADAYSDVNSVVIDLRGYKEKNLAVFNTGGANGLEHLGLS